jgi:hypothetical protein
VKQHTLRVTWEELLDAFKAVFGKSETQLEDQGQEKVKRYTYDDLPAPGDGEIDPETGEISIKRIPKHHIPTWKKVLMLSTILILITAALYLGFTNFAAIETVYAQDERGWYLQYFSGISSQDELHLDYVYDKDGNPLLDQPLVAVADFAVANADYLTTIYVGPKVESIGRWAFNNDQLLLNIIVDPANERYYDVDGVLFARKSYVEVDGEQVLKDLLCLEQYPMGRKAESYTIPEGVEVIGEAAFYNDANTESKNALKNVVFPNSLQQIEEMAFFGNLKLEQLDLPKGLRVIGKDAFSKCVALPAFLFIPANVERVGDYAFYASNSLRTICLERAEGKTELGTKWLPKIESKMFSTHYPEVKYGVSEQEFEKMKEGAQNG